MSIAKKSGMLENHFEVKEEIKTNPHFAVELDY
jgi:hypothetical protein